MCNHIQLSAPRHLNVKTDWISVPTSLAVVERIKRRDGHWSYIATITIKDVAHRRVCTQPDCPIHHPKKQQTKADASFKAEQEKRRREEALANATGLRVLQSIDAAATVRPMKRDLLFLAEQLIPLLDD